MDLRYFAEEIAKFCVGYEGNISTKDNGVIYIKASGTRLKKTLLVKYDFDGNHLASYDRKPSMEFEFHKFLLGFEGIYYVAHSHPTNTLKILCGSMSPIFAENRLFPDQVIFNGKKSCLVPYATPSKNLADAIKLKVNEFIENEGYFPKLILLENHGIITCGMSPEECIIATEICEKSAEIFMGCKPLGSARFLTEEQIEELVNLDAEKYRLNQVK